MTSIDAPMASLFDLGPRHLVTPRSVWAEAEDSKVVRLNRPKGGKRGKKRVKAKAS